MISRSFVNSAGWLSVASFVVIDMDLVKVSVDTIFSCIYVTKTHLKVDEIIDYWELYMLIYFRVQFLMRLANKNRLRIMPKHYKIRSF